MRTVTITQTVYTIDTHPDKEKVFDWIRNNWHDLNNHSLEEFTTSLQELTRRIKGNLDYSFGVNPDRGDNIMLWDYDDDLLAELNADDCPLTGVCWDVDIIKAAQAGEVQDALKVLHLDTEYLYSDEGLTELCQANDYEFTLDGEIFHYQVEKKFESIPFGLGINHIWQEQAVAHHWNQCVDMGVSPDTFIEIPDVRIHSFTKTSYSTGKSVVNTGHAIEFKGRWKLTDLAITKCRTFLNKQ